MLMVLGIPRNHPWNQRITSRFLVQESQKLHKFSNSPYIINHVILIPLYGKQESQKSILESWNQAKIPKDSESRRRRKIQSCGLLGCN